ncbi:MAG: EamA family transporter [Candidatus Woesearchaeota archaeon]|nr:EamA family transporter [Candidatus Woesearchaeota archaeon]
MPSTSILFGLMAMFFWGISKVIAKPAIKRIGPYHALFYEHLVVAIVLSICCIPFVDIAIPTGNTLLLLIAAIIIGALAIYLFFKSIDQGKVSLSTPIAQSSVILTVVLSFIFYGETLSGMQLIAIILLIIGVILVSFKYSEIVKLNFSRTIPGARLALLTLVGWGIYFFLIKPIVIALGPLLSVWYLETGMSILIAIPLLFKGIKNPGKTMIYPLFSGTFVALGSLSFNLGIEKMAVSLFYPIVNSSVFITAICSRIFLREKIDINQKIAIFLIILGLVLISL